MRYKWISASSSTVREVSGTTILIMEDGTTGACSWTFWHNLLTSSPLDPEATKVGVVVFSDDVYLAFSLDTYTDAQSIKDAIVSLSYLGQRTNTPEGLKVAREECFNPANGDRRNVQNLAIFISDGVPHPPERRDPAIREAEALKRVASVVAIGVTPVIDEDLLRTVSSAPQIQNQNWFTATTYDALATIRRAVGQGTCATVEGT